MGRALRTDIGGYVYHVLNRANARSTIFKTKADYELFENVLEGNGVSHRFQSAHVKKPKTSGGRKRADWS